MSTCYRLSNYESALAKENLVAKLAPFGISVVEERAESEKACEGFCLSDGTGFLWAYPVEGLVAGFERFGANDVRKIIDAIEEVCGETMLSEHDEGFLEDGLAADPLDN
jgi:hypothetical protein